MKRFWEEIGLDNEDYAEGHELRASDEWIGELPSCSCFGELTLETHSAREKRKFKADTKKEKRRRKSPGSSGLPVQ